MGTIVAYNGYRIVGPVAAEVDLLLAMLERETLDPRFEQYGNFVIDADAVLQLGEVQFHGNFITYSHAFDVRSDEPEVIARLTAAIRANQATKTYLEAADGLAEQCRRWSARDAADEAERAARRAERAGVAVPVVALVLVPPPARRREAEAGQGRLL